VTVLHEIDEGDNGDDILLNRIPVEASINPKLCGKSVD